MDILSRLEQILLLIYDWSMEAMEVGLPHCWLIQAVLQLSGSLPINVNVVAGVVVGSEL